MAEWHNKDLEEAFKKKLPEWYEVCNSYGPSGPDRSTVIGLCPECGERTLYCCRNDFGHVDCEPKFTHICINPKCIYVIEEEIQGVSFPDIETRRDYCPWCKE